MEHFTPKRDNLIDADVIFNTLSNFTKPNSPKVPTIKDFCIIKPISRGAFGKVFLGYKNNNAAKLFAIKVMRKSEMINKNMVSQVVTERNALALSRSPFCVSLFYSLQTITCVYLVMEYMVGGDLKSLVAMYGFFDESAARFYCAEIALALQYLHEHGIVHRDIKPDNMLIASSGHVKLTDFGLSKIELRRDLEISDLINCSPNFNTRTPGQLLSLTSHLSFGSGEKKLLPAEEVATSSNFLNTIHRHRTSDSDLDNSLTSNKTNDESKMSGVSPFFSMENIDVGSINQTTSNNTESLSSYYTCSSSVGSEPLSSTGNNSSDQRVFVFNKNFSRESSIPKENDKENRSSMNVLLTKVYDKKYRATLEISENNKMSEDSGVSCRKSDSSNVNSEESTQDKNIFLSTKEELSCSDYNGSNTNELVYSRNECNSPIRNNSRSFKRPGFFGGLKRKRNFTNRVDSILDDTSGSTGLTQEIDVLDLGSSTPKKRKAKSPLKGVLKVTSISDDELPINDHLGNVLFSTPVSSQKIPRRDGILANKIKNTRFALPPSVEQIDKKAHVSENLPLRLIKMQDEPIMSPINPNSADKTPKKVQTPFRTPKSVRRGDPEHSDERILGTPDYLAPELLLVQGHGPAVDWWALGVCLYEFMTGVPPFNDETPQKVFQNILNRNIEWPQDDEALSKEAVEAVEQLLTMDPKTRPSAKDVHKMAFFETIDWQNMESIEPPFVPNPDDPTDTGYFEARNVMQHLQLSNFDVDTQE